MKLDVGMLTHDLKSIPAYARKVEALGFDCLWSSETQHDPYLPLAVAATATTRVKLGTAIAVAFPRSPMVTAQIAFELQEATAGRFVLGLGTQVKAHVERRYGSAFEHPGPRMREYVQAVKASFRAFRGTEPLQFAGDFYSLSLLPDMWSPGAIDPPDPPIYIAAVNPWMCRMIGEVADGVHVHPLHSIRYIEEVVRPAIATGAARAGRDADSIAFVCPLLTIVGDTEEERAKWRERARIQLAFYGSTRTYAKVFELHGWPGTSERLHELQAKGDVAGMAATVTDEMLAVLALESSWDDLADGIVDRYAGIADRVVCYFATASWERHPPTRDRWAEVARAVTRR
jgi:probable F420-dependent oxidoreductase